jgi:hypothetical protein
LGLLLLLLLLLLVVDVALFCSDAGAPLRNAAAARFPPSFSWRRVLFLLPFHPQDVQLQAVTDFVSCSEGKKIKKK